MPVTEIVPTYYTLKYSKVCNFGSLGQSVVQLHKIPYTICQRATPILRPNTAGTIGIVRQGEAFCSRYNCRLSG